MLQERPRALEISSWQLSSTGGPVLLRSSAAQAAGAAWPPDIPWSVHLLCGPMFDKQKSAGAHPHLLLSFPGAAPELHGDHLCMPQLLIHCIVAIVVADLVSRPCRGQQQPQAQLMATAEQLSKITAAWPPTGPPHTWWQQSQGEQTCCLAHLKCAGRFH